MSGRTEDAAKKLPANLAKSVAKTAKQGKSKS